MWPKAVDPVDLDSRCGRFESSCSVGVGRLSAENRNLMNDTPSADLPPVAMARAARQAEGMASLRKLLPRHAILSRPEDTVPYECDGLTAYRTVPLVVLLPETEAQVTAVLKTCHGLGVPIVCIALCRLTSAAFSTCRALRLCQ